VDFDGDFGGRVLGVCCYGFLDLGGVGEEGLVQGFELVLAVVDGVGSAVDCGGLEGGEGGGHCWCLDRCNLVVVLV
jgi:hypothetical protein